MKMLKTERSEKKQVSALFTSVFAASEGTAEGALIGNLALELANGIDDKEILCFGCYEEQHLCAAIFFTRLKFSSPAEVYMLAPVAVDTAHQGKGIGQALIAYGLNDIKCRGIKVAVTYGDPAFYQKTGFRPLSEELLPAPLKLSIPMGWQGQSLTQNPIPKFADRPVCVKAFRNPDFW